MAEHPVEFGEESPRPDRSDGDLHAEHRFDTEDDAEFVGEGGQPVVPVSQDDDLAVVAHLEELFGAAMHVADDRLGAHDPLAVDDDPQPENPVRRWVLRPDVEDHVGAREAAGPHADHDVAAFGRSAHAAMLSGCVLAERLRRSPRNATSLSRAHLRCCR